MIVVTSHFFYLLKNKSDALDGFKPFVYEVENQHDRKDKRLRSKSGTEYDLDIFYASITHMK